MTIPEMAPIPLTATRLADAVYERIGEAILSGALAPGAKIRDADLAHQLGVSRMPVREALQRLERVGLVEMSPSRYTRVTEVTPELARASFEYFGYQAALAARLSAARMGDDARREALSRIDELCELLSDPPAFFRAAGEFFLHLATHSGNPVFVHVVREGWLGLIRNLRGHTSAWDGDAELRQHFEELREAIASGDGDAAERTVRRRHGLDN